VDAVVLTIGHSNRSLDEFTDLIERNAVDVLVDVRTHPGSRRLPHFGQERLRRSLEQAPPPRSGRTRRVGRRVAQHLVPSLRPACTG
jgi:hypothetical protein